jgi:hypothetical protein
MLEEVHVNVNTGKLYDNYDDAIKAGEKPEDIVEVFGNVEAIDRLSKNVRKTHKRKRKQEKLARRKNRKGK